MDEKVELGKITVSSLLAYFTLISEDSAATRLLLILLLLMIFDTLMGNAKAKKNGVWESSKAKWGAIGKVFQFGLIALAQGFSWALGVPQIEYWFIVYFCLVEVGSILENAYALGLAIPKGIVDIASKTKYFLGHIFVDWSKNAIQSVTKMDFDELDKAAQKEQENEKKKKEQEKENEEE